MPSPEPKNLPIFKLNYLLFFLFLIFFLRSITNQASQQISYSEFQNHLKQGEVSEVTITGENVTGELKSKDGGRKKFITTLVNPEIAQQFDKYKIKYTKVPESPFIQFIFSFIIPFIIFWWIISYLMRKRFGKDGIASGFMSVGKSKAKIYLETDTKVTFNDVAGADEALEELKEVIEFLKNSEKIKQLGGKMPKGILLVGPPGTGKTLIAKAIAGEAGVPFYSTNGAEFVEMFVGVGAARVRDLFEQAKKTSPCIIFIDELDALGKTRHISPLGSNDEKEQTLNQLLVEMDGFDTRSGVIILAATNRPEIIDPALLRAGRFDRQVMVDKPDRKGRADILKIHIKNVKMDSSINLDDIASLTPGFSGADLANLVNEAALIATREDATSINMDHFTKGLERMMAGLQKKNRLLSGFEREVVAHHEMGHAMVGYAFNKADIIHKISIIPRGIGSMGYTIQRPTEDRYVITKKELENKMTVLLGGRAAETLIFSHLSTGASDDLMKATNIAREMVTKFGMFPDIGFVSFDESPTSPWSLEGLNRHNYSEKTSQEIDEHIKHLVMEAYHRAYNFLKENRSHLERAAQELMKHETLTEAELVPIFNKLSKPQSTEFSWRPKSEHDHPPYHSTNY